MSKIKLFFCLTHKSKSHANKEEPSVQSLGHLKLSIQCQLPVTSGQPCWLGSTGRAQPCPGPPVTAQLSVTLHALPELSWNSVAVFPSGVQRK